MKRIFRKIAEFLGLVKPKKITHTIEVDWDKIDDEAIFNETKKPNTTPYESMSNGVYEEVLNSKKPTPPRKVPKDANDIQKLSTKYNNPKTVYRDNKGRYASLTK